MVMFFAYFAIESDAVGPGNSIPVKFINPAIPLHGEDECVEKHYVSKHSCRQKEILAVLAQDASNQASCCATAEVHKV